MHYGLSHLCTESKVALTPTTASYLPGALAHSVISRVHMPHVTNLCELINYLRQIAVKMRGK